MPAALGRFQSTCTDSSASDCSSAPSSSTFTPPSSRRGFRPAGMPSLAAPLHSHSAYLDGVSTEDLEALLAARLAAEQPPPQRKMVAPAPPAYPYPASQVQPPKLKSISSGSGRKKVFGLFGASRASRTSSASFPPLSSLPSPVPPSIPRDSPLIIHTVASHELPTVSSVSITSPDVAPRQAAFAPAAPAPAPVPAVSGEKSSFAKYAMKQTRRVRASMRRKLTSKSPLSELPTTWEEYGNRYAKHEIDLDDPPLPPSRAMLEAASGGPVPPTPFEERVWVAPTPANETTRQAIVAKLDLFGSRRPSSISPSATSSDAVESLENHPAFRAIIQKCRDTFDTRVGMLTVLDDDMQLFLATGGMPEGVDALPRSVTFCSHAIQAERGLVVLDSQRDWRFANNVPSAVLGARFYAGVPLLAPTFGDESAPPIAIGTLCVVDDRPHESFTEEQREVLREFAAEASREVEGWVDSRMGDKLERLEELFQEARLADELPPTPPGSSHLASPPAPASSFANCALVASPPSSSSFTPPNAAQIPSVRRRRLTPPPSPAPTIGLPPTPPSHPLQRSGSADSSLSTASLVGRRDSDWSQLSVSTDASSMHSVKSNRGLALRVVTEEPISAIAKDVQKVFDMATSMLSKSTDLSLVYLVALDLSNPSYTLTLLSSCGLPTPAPSFDPILHFKALRAPEGGLLYQNTRGGNGFASGLLVPLLEVRQVGYVLAGYTYDIDRVFGERDMKYFVRFAQQLEPWVSRVGRVSP